MKLLESPAQNEPLWEQLPPMYWFYPVSRLKPACDVWLTHPTATMENGLPTPLLAVHQYGKGSVLYLGVEETWRWRYNEADRWFGRFWTQLIYQVGVPRTLGSRLTQLALDAPEPQLGQTGQLIARLLQPDFSPQEAEQVEATLERLELPPGDPNRLTRFTLRRLPGAAGEYVASVPFQQAGRFQFTVDNAGHPGTLEYRVTIPPDHELAPGGLQDWDLKPLAEATGGTYWLEDAAFDLPDALRSQVVRVPRRESVVLWGWWSWAVIVLGLGLEWICRKWFSLS